MRYLIPLFIICSFYGCLSSSNKSKDAIPDNPRVYTSKENDSIQALKKEFLNLLDNENCDRVIYTNTSIYKSILSSNRNVQFTSDFMSNDLEFRNYMKENKFREIDSISFKVENDTLFIEDLYTFKTSYPDFAYIRVQDGKYHLQLAYLKNSDKYHVVDGAIEEKEEVPVAGVIGEILLKFKVSLNKINSNMIIYKEREIILNK